MHATSRIGNPKGTEWGNMSWFSATSTDLVRWTPHGQQPSLKPDKTYDREGIFTGCVLPRGPCGQKNMMTAIYTSVSSLFGDTVSSPFTDHSASR